MTPCCPRGRRNQRADIGWLRRQPDEPRKRLSGHLGRLLRGWKHVAAGHVGLRGRHAVAERGRPGEGRRAGVAGLGQTPLNVHTSLYPRQGRPHLHHDLTSIGQAQPDHLGQVARPEQRGRGSTAQVLDAPRIEAGSIDRRHTKRHLLIVTRAAVHHRRSGMHALADRQTGLHLSTKSLSTINQGSCSRPN